MEQESSVISKYNEMEQHLYRINIRWINCHKFSTEGNYSGWNWELDRVRLELSYDITTLDKSSKHDYEKGLNELDKKIVRALTLGLLKSLYKLLMEKESLLRMVQQESGKGTEYMDKDFNMRMLG